MVTECVRISEKKILITSEKNETNDSRKQKIMIVIVCKCLKVKLDLKARSQKRVSQARKTRKVISMLRPSCQSGTAFKYIKSRYKSGKLITIITMRLFTKKNLHEESTLRR